ncbi:MAG TPA: hypothetical protein VKS21_12375 [Spirochaetota bacterium]|nr:hypothetical protein [Spirochaetota bacterium]
MSKLTKISALVLALLPPVYILSITGWLHTIPNNDYWHFFFTPVLGAQSLPDILQAFFTRSNEHLVVIPNIIFYLN